EYVAAANCCRQVLWIQNQMMDYGFNFMNTKIHIDNESTICIVKNPVYLSGTKHIEIQHHFIRNCYEKRLIDVIKIHTDANLADLLTKGFDVTRFKFLVLGMLVWLILPGQHLVLPDLVCVAQKYLEFNYGVDDWIGLKMQFGLDLRFVDQHNMVACLEKIQGNSNFHEIVDFPASSSIHLALTNNAIVDSKVVVVTETSIRSSLLFNDANGTACLTNEAIFQNLALMGYEEEGEGSREPTKPQPTPSPTQPSTKDQPLETSPSHATTQDSRDSLERTNGNEGDQELSVLCTNLSNRVLALESIKDAQAAKIGALKSRIKKLEKKCKPSISHHKAWLKSVNRLSMMKRFGKKESVSKQRRKKSKPESTLDDSTVFDDQDADHGMEYMETKEVVDKGSTTRPEVNTARPDIDTAGQEDNVDDSSRPARSILTLNPLPTIDPKVKGKGVLKESPELAEIEREREERQRHDQASVDYIASLYDEVQAKIDASEELAAKLQMEERERCKYRHNQLNKKTFEEIQVLYIKEQERDVDFMPIRSERDEQMINKMNKKVAGMDEEEVLEEPKSTKIVPDEEEEIDYEVLGTRANETSRYIKTFTEMVSRFDRLDFIKLHSLVMQKFSTTTPEGIDLVLWGDLRIMFEETADDDIWKNQEKWIIKSWIFYKNYGVHILALEDGTEIHVLAERRYPLIRETLERMMELRLTAESEGKAVFDLLRFIQKQIDEFGGQDGSEKDL
ncbi:hypothetical protein Tco_0685844, partial [Tanacetum coccineum]